MRPLAAALAAFLLAALLVPLATATAGPAPSQTGPGSTSGAVPPAIVDHLREGAQRHGDLGQPFAATDLVQAIGLIRAQGPVQAARTLQEPQGNATGVGPEPEESLLTHDFAAIGDINGNGRDDVVLRTVDEDGTGTLQALDGGRVGDVLWTLNVTDEEHGFVIGDIDLDGVADLASLRQTGEGFDEEGMSMLMAYSFRSGRDLSDLGAMDCVFEVTTTHEEGPMTDVPRRSQWRETWRFEHPWVEDGVAGFGRYTWLFEVVQTTEQLVFLHMASSVWANTTNEYVHYNLDGSTLLATGPDSQVQDAADLDGDQVADLIMTNGMRFAHSSGSSLPPMFDPIPLPFRGQQPVVPPLAVRAVNGATGADLWSQTFDESTEGYVQAVGDLFGEGEVLLLNAYHGETGRAQWSLLRGSDGSAANTQAGWKWFDRLGDANGDGRDDLLESDFEEDDAVHVRALDGQLQELWSETLADMFFLHDVDQDGVEDLLLAAEDEVTRLDGATGQQAWSVADDRFVGLGFAHGLAGEGSAHVALLLSDRPDGGDLSNYAAEMVVLRGSDGAPLWAKPLYDPLDYVDVAGDEAFLWTQPAGDLDGDGVGDLIVSLQQGYTLVMHTSCDEDDCETDVEDSREDDEGDPLAITLLVSGADGRTITRFDDMRLAPKVDVVQEAPVDVAPAARELAPEQDAPGLPLVLVLAALAAALVVGRKP